MPDYRGQVSKKALRELRKLNERLYNKQYVRPPVPPARVARPEPALRIDTAPRAEGGRFVIADKSVLSRLRPGDYRIACPNCPPDKRDNMSITIKPDRVLYHCFRCEVRGAVYRHSDETLLPHWVMDDKKNGARD